MGLCDGPGTTWEKGEKGSGKRKKEKESLKPRIGQVRICLTQVITAIGMVRRTPVPGLTHGRPNIRGEHHPIISLRLVGRAPRFASSSISLPTPSATING
jgi:hypothetical protein